MSPPTPRARTVPLALVAVLLEQSPALHPLVREHGRVIGDRLEVDMDSLARAAPQLAAAIEAFDRDTQALWASGAGPFVLTRRDVVDHKQVTAKTGREDLTDVFTELGHLSLTAELLDAVTCPDPDPAVVHALADQLAGSADLTDGAWHVTVPLEGAVAWPACLGGPPGHAEVSRALVITCRHAPWRDRRVRRLARVRVHVEEMWADPSRSRALLPS